jgi:hypothetical protein
VVAAAIAGTEISRRSRCTSHAIGRGDVVSHRRECSLVEMREYLPSPLITTDGRVERGVRVTAQHREVDCRGFGRVVVGKREETVP